MMLSRREALRVMGIVPVAAMIPDLGLSSKLEVVKFCSGQIDKAWAADIVERKAISEAVDFANTICVKDVVRCWLPEERARGFYDSNHLLYGEVELVRHRWCRLPDEGGEIYNEYFYLNPTDKLIKTGKFEKCSNKV